MKKIFLVVALFLFSFTVAMGAGKTSSKKQVVHPPVAISYLNFKGGPNGEKIAFTISNPNIMNEFEHPVLCPPYNDPVYGNESMPFCGTPMVFMNKGGEVVFWQEIWEGSKLSEYEVEGGSITDQALGHNPDYWVVETPKSMYYCLYKGHKASNCQLFPYDADIKVGDKFSACSTGPVSWPTDKNGVMTDCSEPTKDYKTILYAGRIADFTVVSITNGEIYLHCLNRYGFGTVSEIPLNENGRIDIMGTMSGQSDIFMMVKHPSKPQPEKPKTKKK